MSIAKCLNDKVKAGKITQAQADDVLKTLKSLERETGAFGNAEALSKTAKKIIEDADFKEKVAVGKIVAQQTTLGWAKSHVKGIEAGVASIFARDWWGTAGHESVASTQQAVKNLLHGAAADFVESFRPKIGLRARDVPSMRAMIYENYGIVSGNETAAAASRGIRSANDLAFELANEALAGIPKKENWRQVQRQNPDVVRGLGKEKYTELNLDAFDKGWLKINDWGKNAGSSVSREKAKEIIEGAYERISTNGLSDLVPGEEFGTTTAKRRAFEWTTPEAWLWQNDTFGLGDTHIFDAFVSHLDNMSRDIGLLRVLGPDPDATAKMLIDTVKKTGKGTYNIEALYDHLTGRVHIPQNVGAANFFRGLRELLSSAQLGSAVLSTTGDFVSLSHSAAWMGLPQMKLAQEYVGLLSPASRADRGRAARSAFIAESFTHNVSSLARGQMEDFGTGLTAKIADTVIRASGLTAHTDAAKMAFQRVAMANLADLSSRQFKNLPEETKRFFAAHGITESDWEKAVKHGLVDYGNGIKFIEPLAMVKSGDKTARDAGIKMYGALLEESNIAVPTPGVLERALVVGKTRPGTLEGELLRSVGQYKGFMASLMTGQGMRAINELRAGHGAYISTLAVGLTAAGALTIQLKAIANGKDPREMFGDPQNSAKFWGAAFIQGGGAGIFGDFLYSSATRSSSTSPFTTFVGGPIGGLADQIAHLGMSNVTQAAQDRDTNVGAETATLIRRITPGSTLWYARLGLDRLLFDQLHKQLDPDYSSRFARQEQKARKEYGQSFWWRPGQSEPSRSPDMSAIVK